MNPKKLFTLVLLVFVAASVGYMVAREQKSPAATAQNSESLSPPQPAVGDDTEQANPNQQIIVYYFHGDVRCPTCHKLEDYTRETLETFFANDVADGSIKWMPVNVDRAENEHFIKDYELVTKSVVASKVVDGREVAWKNLDRIWQLVMDKDKYLEYIRGSINEFTSEAR